MSVLTGTEEEAERRFTNMEPMAPPALLNTQRSGYGDTGEMSFLIGSASGKGSILIRAGPWVSRSVETMWWTTPAVEFGYNCKLSSTSFCNCRWSKIYHLDCEIRPSQHTKSRTIIVTHTFTESAHVYKTAKRPRTSTPIDHFRTEAPVLLAISACSLDSEETQVFKR